MHMSRRLLAGFVFVALGGVWAVFPLWAGPLSPPAGPVAPSYKTLQEVEPRTAVNATNTPGDATAVYVIDKPGSYYLTENLVGQAGKNGIRIEAPNVMLDLNGFTLDGFRLGANGVFVSTTAAFDVTIVNGVVRRWADAGVWTQLSRARIQDVIAYDNGAGVVAGVESIVASCQALGNSGPGVVVGANSIVEGCVAAGNQGHGFTLSSSIARRCAARDNSGDGFNATSSTIESCRAINNNGDGIQAAGSNNLIRDNVSSGNAQNGVRVAAQSLVVGNTCNNNGLNDGDPLTGAGVLAMAEGVRIEANNLTKNDYGVQATLGRCVIIRNTAFANNTNFDFNVANNVYGPIVAGVGMIVNNTPEANYSY